MRTALMPYENQFVLAKGWITDWKDDEKTQKRRIYVSNVMVKKADKNRSFNNQLLISEEDHLNFFIPMDHLPYIPCEKYKCLALAGFIHKYNRSNGSMDYGINLIDQSLAEDHIFEVCERAKAMTSIKLLTPKSLNTLHSLKKQIIECEKELEDAGDLLPTFYNSYAEYKRLISILKDSFEQGILVINSVCSNRALRRKHGIKNNFASALNRQTKVHRLNNLLPA